MKIYKNKKLIMAKIDDDYYSIVNPFIENGFRVINKDQFGVLSLIQDEISIEELCCISGYNENELLGLCALLSKQEIVGFEKKFSHVKIDDNSTPFFTLWVHTTNNCCLRCTYCDIHTLGNNMFMNNKTIGQLSTKIEETVVKHNVKQVLLRLSGGEPLLYWKLWKNEMRELKARLESVNCKLKVALLTNLVLLSEDIIEWILNDDIEISVSFDGIESYQDKSRHFNDGRGSFNIVNNNLLKLMDYEIYPFIMTVVSDSNADGLPMLSRFLIEHNLRFRYSFVRFESLNLRNVISKMEECFDIFSNAIDNGYSFSDKFHLCDLKFFKPRIQTCFNGNSGAAIYVNGDVYFCHTQFGYESKNGSIFEDKDLMQIIHDGSIFSRLNLHEECKNCNLRFICSGGCPVKREDGMDPHCLAYKILVPQVYKLIGKEHLFHHNHHNNNNN